MDKRTQFPFEGGETSAINRLNYFVWGNNNGIGKGVGPIKTYKKTRNGSVGSDYSTKFSPFLAHGNLSPRLIYNNIKHFEQTTGITHTFCAFCIFVCLKSLCFFFLFSFSEICSCFVLIIAFFLCVS